MAAPLCRFEVKGISSQFLYDESVGRERHPHCPRQGRAQRDPASRHGGQGEHLGERAMLQTKVKDFNIETLPYDKDLWSAQ